MSFRYENQIQMLKDTYKWALDANIDELNKCILKDIKNAPDGFLEFAKMKGAVIQ